MTMIERGSVFETLQLGAEVTPGTQVDALKRLRATNLQFDPQVPITGFRPMGSIAETTEVIGKDWTQGAVNGDMGYNDLAYLFSSLFCKPVIATPGGGTLSRTWTFKPQNYGPDLFQTYTAERGSYAGAERVLFAIINALELRFTKDAATVTGAMLGRSLSMGVYMSKDAIHTVNLGGATGGTFKLTFGGQQTGALAFNIVASALQTALEGLSTVGTGNVLVTAVSAGVYTLEFIRVLGQAPQTTTVGDFTLLTGATGPAITATQVGVVPTDIPEQVIDPNSVAIYTGPDTGTLSRLRRVQEIAFGAADRFAPVMDLQDDQTSFANVVQKAPALTSHIIMQRNSDYVTLFNFLKAKTKRIVRITGTSVNLIETGYPYTFRLTFPVQLRNPRHGSAEEQETGQIDMIPCYDATFGGWAELVLQNGLTAL